jgi:hypothetical protein
LRSASIAGSIQCRDQGAACPLAPRSPDTLWRQKTPALPMDAGDDPSLYRFTAMKAGSVLINVARGEIIDEEALADALRRDHLRGAALDVYVGEFEHAPMARLWSDPRVLITPHISGASDQDRHGAINVFCANLRA